MAVSTDRCTTCVAYLIKKSAPGKNAASTILFDISDLPTLVCEETLLPEEESSQ